jgi:hypothetical protein
MLLGCTSLTHLSLGPHTMTHPLISCLAEMHSPAWTANIPARRASQQQQQQQQQQKQQVAVPGGRPGPAGVCESLAADCVADRVFALEPARAVPAPPPLASLRLVLQSRAHVNRTVRHLGCLTGLTRLALGWIAGAQVGGEGSNRLEMLLECLVLIHSTACQLDSVSVTVSGDLAIACCCSCVTVCGIKGLEPVRADGSVCQPTTAGVAPAGMGWCASHNSL